ncbi:MAG TPA: hypothetical protein VFA00_15425 [Actinomycetota bacterium]|nr:hypothetical protein [Actinomycetota bacterium]
MGVTDVVQWAIPILVVAYVVARGFRVDARLIGQWAAGSGLRLTPTTHAMVARYLKWTRRCRVVGGLAGFVGPIAYSMATDNAFPIGNGLVLILAGYLVGALVAEPIQWVGRRLGPALLIPRRLPDYLPSYVSAVQRGLAAVSVGMVGLWALTPYPNQDVPEPKLSTFALYGIAGIGIAVVIELLQRVVVARRQPATGADVVEADDAIRSASVHALAGGGIGLLLIVVASEVAAFTPLGGAAGWSLALLSLFLNFSALFFWLELGKPRGHKVGRVGSGGASA